MSELDDHTYGSGIRHSGQGLDLEPATGEESNSVEDDTVFDPGPSFIDDDQPTERLAEMPAWLQTFAAAAIEQDETTREDAPSQSVPSPQVDPESDSATDREFDNALPDWLKDPGASAQEHSPATIHALDDLDDFNDPTSIATNDFISEDDLPDWLRAFSQETSPQPTPPSIVRSVTSRPATTVTATMVRVPPVENVWLSTYERQALGPGPALFALLASNTAGEGGYADTAGDAVSQSHAAMPASAQSGDQTAVQMNDDTGAESATDSEPEAAPQRNSLRLLLITLLVVLVLVILSMQFLS